MDELVKSLVNNGAIVSESIRRAFAKVDRAHFVPGDVIDLAYEDTALPIGEGQTISQPYTVAFLLELLSPRAGDHILDVGSGSGWQTALLAEIVGTKGQVYAIELIRNIYEFGKGNLEKYPELLERVKLYWQNAESGLPREAEVVGGFDGIIVAAEVTEVPKAWRSQLKISGRLIYPQGSSIYKEVKLNDSEWQVNQYPGFAFVPFVNP